MAKIYSFAGQQIVRPGSYTKRNFPNNQGSGNTTGKVVIVGEAAKGGIPYNAFAEVEDIINVVSGQSQALNVFGGGDLYYGAEFFLTPTNDSRFNTPSEALCVVVNQMGQATTRLLNAATEILKIKFTKYGTDGNQAAVKLSAGSTTGKLINLLYKGINVLEKDNVSLPMMDIQYVGAGTSCALSITATKLTTTCTGATTDNLDISFSDFADLGSLINFIDNNPSYVCTLSGKSDEQSKIFDVVSAVDIKTTLVSLFANTEALIRAINASDGFEAELVTGSPRLVPDNVSTFKFLSGGSVSAATTADWIAALEKLSTYDCDCIVAMTGSETIQGLVNAHVEKMNSTKVKKYRQWGAGAGSSANTKKLRIGRMKAINSAYAEYCVCPFKRFDYVNGTMPVNDFDPYYMYAMIAGFRYANNVGMDIVFKYLNIVSTPQISDEDIDDYLAAGATVVQKTSNVIDGTTNFEIIGNSTCYQGSVITRTNPACVYEINKLTKDFEEQVTEQLRQLDSVANSVVIATIQNWIITKLFPRYRDDYKWITDSKDENGKTIKAFDSVTFEQVGEEFKTSADLCMSVTPRYAFNFLTFITPGQSL